MGRIDSHAFGHNGMKTITDTNTYTAGVGDYEDIEAWGPVLVLQDDTQFNAACVVVNGEKPPAAYQYKANTLIGTFFTKIKLTAGAVQAQRVVELQDF